MNNKDFQFGDWWACPGRNLLKSVDQTSQVQIEPKTMDVLVELARHQGKVVSRQQFRDSVWEGRLVVEEGLTRCISELRRALGDNPKKPQYIETLSKRGYRLLLPVSWEKQEIVREAQLKANLIKPVFFKFIGALGFISVLIWFGFYLLYNKPANTQIEIAKPEDLFEMFDDSSTNQMVALWKPTDGNDSYITVRTLKLDRGTDRQISLRLFDDANIRLLDTILPFGSESEQYEAIAKMVASLELLKARHAHPGILKLPEHLRLSYQQALLLATEGDEVELQEAVEKFDAILREQPSFVEGIIGKLTAMRGIAGYKPINERANFIDLHKLLLQRITLIQQDHPYVIANSYRPNTNNIDWSEYEQVLQNVVAELPGCFECVESLANFYLNVGWREKAIALHKKHLAYYPTSSQAHAELAMIYSRAGNIERMKKHTDLVRLMNNERWLLTSEINYSLAIGNTEDWVERWEQYHDRFDFDKPSRDSAAAIASHDMDKLNELIAQMPRVSFNLLLTAGQIDRAVDRVEANVRRGNYFDLSLVHGWRYQQNPLNRHYLSGLAKLQNHPRIFKLIGEIGLFKFWQRRDQWPDDCALAHPPAYCKYKRQPEVSET